MNTSKDLKKMNKNRKFIRDVIKILELGESGKYTKDEVKNHIKDHKIDGVHVFGSKGLLEGSDDGRYRLNLHGLELLLTHRSIEQSKKQSKWALWIATCSLVITAFALFWNIYPARKIDSQQKSFQHTSIINVNFNFRK